MQFLPFFRYIFLILFLGIMITQVIWPLFRGTQLFPFFKRERKLENKLTEIKQKNLEKKLEKEMLKKEK